MKFKYSLPSTAGFLTDVKDKWQYSNVTNVIAENSDTTTQLVEFFAERIYFSAQFKIRGF